MTATMDFLESPATNVLLGDSVLRALFALEVPPISVPEMVSAMMGYQEQGNVYVASASEVSHAVSASQATSGLRALNVRAARPLHVMETEFAQMG